MYCLIIIKRLRYILRRYEFKLRIRRMGEITSKKICIFQTPLHKNIGDHFITVSERKFLNNLNIDLPVFEVPNEMFFRNREFLKKSIYENDIIIITGGGFIGNIWEGEEQALESILENFPDNKIIIFPQTIYFDKNKSSYKTSLEKCKYVLEHHKNLVVFVRERNSYNFIKTNMKNVNVKLVPDIALSYPKIKNIDKKYNCIGLCLRNDVEMGKNKKVIEKIKQILKNNNMSILKTDTIAKSRVFESDREQQCLNKIKEFAQYRIVVTDRLHGMIFSYLGCTPCIVLDNKTNKVSGVYNEWLKNCKNIICIQDEFDENIIVNFVKDIIDSKAEDRDCIDMNKFNILIEEFIKSGK